ncbi:MAG: hypothetical protein GX024_06960 [Clostridiales bacterium]|jgi:hypothetical protein|nr:hypothetical protein [Clostridiales bacterium]
MKRKSLLIAVTVVILIGGALILHLTSILKPKNELKIGKPLVLVVEEGQNMDFKAIENMDLWDKKQRKLLSKYMKENNLRIIAGKYYYNQTTTFKEALEIFRFEKID